MKLPEKLQTLQWGFCGPLMVHVTSEEQPTLATAETDFLCLWDCFEGETKKKTFMKLVHCAFMKCSLSANGKTPTGPLSSSHITRQNTYICTGSCHTVSGVCQRFASAQTTQVFERTGSFRFSVVPRQ